MNLRQTIATAGLLLASAACLATPSAWFVVEGNTFTSQFKITNTSDDVEVIKALTLELPTSPTAFVFNTTDIYDQSGSLVNRGVAFAPAVNSYLLDTSRTQVPADQSTRIDLAFGSLFFGSGGCGNLDCQFGWSIDVDTLGGSIAAQDVAVFGNQLFGARISVTLGGANGDTVLTGLLGACPAGAESLGNCHAGNRAAYWEGSGTASGGGTVPEPGSLVLAGLALVGLGFAHRAKRA